MNGLMVGFPPRSICSRVPSSRWRLIEAQTPIDRAAEHVVGYLQHDRVDVVVGEVVVPGPGEAVQGAFDVGEERVAAQPGEQPDPARLDGLGGAVEADRDAPRRAPRRPGSGWRAWAPVAYQAVPVCLPFSYSENTNVNATSAWLSPSVEQRSSISSNAAM